MQPCNAQPVGPWQQRRQQQRRQRAEGAELARCSCMPNNVNTGSRCGAALVSLQWRRRQVVQDQQACEQAAAAWRRETRFGSIATVGGCFANRLCQEAGTEFNVWQHALKATLQWLLNSCQVLLVQMHTSMRWWLRMHAGNCRCGTPACSSSSTGSLAAGVLWNSCGRTGRGIFMVGGSRKSRRHSLVVSKLLRRAGVQGGGRAECCIALQGLQRLCASVTHSHWVWCGV